MIRRAAALLLVIVTAQLPGPAPIPAPVIVDESLSAAEARGKHLYIEGESLSRRIITAQVQRTEAPAPASIVPCISCHSADGRGSDDAIASSNVSWNAMTSPDRHQHGQRVHAPYDEETLARAITEGVDPDGNSLEAIMPRYNMSDEDMADLIAYLKVIDSQADPGISATSIRLGTVLPMEGQHAGLGRAMRDMIEACFGAVNASGGVHGRKLELVVGSWGASDDPPIWQARDLLAAEPLFALLSPYIPNYDAELQALAIEQRIPVIGPYTVLPPGGDDRYSFYLQAGLAQQAETLVEAIATEKQGGQAKLGIVYPRVRSFDSLAEAASRRASALDLGPVVSPDYPLNQFDGKAIVATLRDAQVDAVLFLGSAAELVELGDAAERAGWRPYLLAPGLLAERQVFELPQSFSGRVLLAYASLPTDYSPAGVADFEQLHEDYGFDYQHSIAQIAAYTAAKLLVEGLERAGRGLNREQLVDTLERLEGFHAGLLPPISYGPGRRMGTLGAHIVRVDLAASRFDESTQWIAPGGTTDGK
jgi:ABC-type branched-subunit amino acid transport system substrate-binding protein